MNKFERRAANPADTQSGANAPAGVLSSLAEDVVDIGDEPPIAPKVSLTQNEVLTILLSLLLSIFLVALDQTIVAPALPTIGQQFQDVSNLSWIISAYLLSSTAVAPVFGTLSDIYGRRAMVITALSLFIAGSVACALAPNLITLILARGLQGLGGGGIMPIAHTIIADVVSPRERGKYQGYLSGVWAIAGVGGPILGGVFAEHLHWSLIFWINVPLGAASLALLLPKMGRIPVFHRKRKVDWLGGVLLMAAAVIFMLVLTWGGSRYSWLSPTIMAMIGASGALLLGFIWQAQNVEEPFVPLQLLRGSVVPYALIAGGCTQGALVAVTVHLPLYFDFVYHFTASEAGFSLIPLAVCSTIGSAAAGRAMQHAKHYKRIAIGGLSLAAIAGCILSVVPLPPWPLQALIALYGMGLGTGFPVTVIPIQNAVPKSQVGTISGAMNFCRSLTASLAVATFSGILFMTLGADISAGGGEHSNLMSAISPADMVAAFRHLFIAATAMMVVGLCCLLKMEERPLVGPANH